MLQFTCGYCLLTLQVEGFVNEQTGIVECPQCANRIIYLEGAAPKGFSRNMIEDVCDNINWSDRNDFSNDTLAYRGITIPIADQPPADRNLVEWIEEAHGKEAAIDFLIQRVDIKFHGAGDRIHGKSDGVILTKWLYECGMALLSEQLPGKQTPG